MKKSTKKQATKKQVAFGNRGLVVVRFRLADSAPLVALDVATIPVFEAGSGALCDLDLLKRFDFHDCLSKIIEDYNQGCAENDPDYNGFNAFVKCPLIFELAYLRYSGENGWVQTDTKTIICDLSGKGLHPKEIEIIRNLLQRPDGDWDWDDNRWTEFYTRLEAYFMTEILDVMRKELQ